MTATFPFRDTPQSEKPSTLEAWITRREDAIKLRFKPSVDFQFPLNQHTDDGWIYRSFRGNKWQKINKAERQSYLKNAYRVLLTRARQGMVICVPDGDAKDPTRAPEFYDSTYQYLKSIGMDEL
ncbi:hypothetical protein K227x_58330 [Rubripirellula lacrimiformis]|uniref:Schlafen group 3-like DNA/RNA helicase domain-containing protein n=1 Tax=Rubripirellula lacrimiformis TaxID=1930273 RepID=A0A517NJU8_9BACT|nr:DNA/RNA helicase domain-containing protein [Rubripirellula lacrimiformis]QDT07406.1 hypothetical protein K227x_58330 [Rubripirellula lacrimiformis]